MTTIYNSQLDAFELYHLIREPSSHLSSTSTSASSPLLEALGHAFSGSLGAALSNILIYPLDLIITRSQIQRQLRKDQNTKSEEEYVGLEDAVRKIVERDGWGGLFRGVKGDTVKTVLDVGGFFLVYSYFRGRVRARKGGEGLRGWEELGVGWVAGAVVKAVVMPCSVVVAKAQTGGMGEKDKGGEEGLMEIARRIYDEKGAQGFWAGYQAALVLTLNPSLTFALHAVLSRAVLPRRVREKPGAVTTFLLSATSKAIASAVMYPFSLAKTRLMVGGKKEEEYEREATGEVKAGGRKGRLEKEVLKDTLLSTLLGIVEKEGYGGLYEGLHLEVCKGFLSHGITMVVKQAIQRFMVKMWWVFGILMRRYKQEINGGRLRQKARENVEYYNLAMARAGERIEDTVKETAELAKSKANETAEFVAEYVEETDTPEWRNLYGPLGLSRWLEGDRHEPE